MAIFAQPASEFAGGSGFTGALQADDEENAGGIVGEAELGFMAAEDLDQFLVDNADDLLGRCEAGEDFLAHGLDFHGLNQLLDDFEIDVGFKEGDADFAKGGFHVLRGETALATHIFEDALEFIGEIIEHGLESWQLVALRQGVQPKCTRDSVLEVALAAADGESKFGDQSLEYEV